MRHQAGGHLHVELQAVGAVDRTGRPGSRRRRCPPGVRRPPAGRRCPRANACRAAGSGRGRRQDRRSAAVVRWTSPTPHSGAGPCTTEAPSAAASCWAPRQTPRTGRPASTAARSRARSSANQARSSCTLIGPPMTTSPAMSVLRRRAEGWRHHGPSAGQSDRRRCRLIAPAMAPGPSKATCCTSSQGSPAPMSTQGMRMTRKSSAERPSREPGQLRVAPSPVADPLRPRRRDPGSGSCGTAARPPCVPPWRWCRPPRRRAGRRDP